MPFALSKLRFKIRTLLIAVAIVAACLAIVMMKRRSDDYREWERYYANNEQLGKERSDGYAESLKECEESLAKATTPEEIKLWSEMKEETSKAAASNKSELDRCSAKRAQYRYAASHPWIYVPPDPLQLAQPRPDPPEPE